MSATDTPTALGRLQPPALVPVLGCILLLVTAPEHWRFTPDSGIYIGSALELLENGRYWFNGYPNLFYYPGTSLTLAPVLALFDLRIQSLQFCMVLLGCAVLLCCHQYYQDERDRHLTSVLVFFVFCNSLFLASSMAVVSTILFTFLVMLSFVSWKRFQAQRGYADALICLALVAFAPLVRMEGVFLAMAFCLALGVDQWQRHGFRVAARRSLLASLLSALPFLLWTLRNYLQYHPEAFSRLNFAREAADKQPMLYAPIPLTPDAASVSFQDVASNLGITADALLNTVIHFRIGEFVLPAVSGFIVVSLLALGCARWMRRSHLLEIGFFLLLAPFLIFQQQGYLDYQPIVTRYWAPLVPSLLAMSILGYRHLRRLAESQVPRLLVTGFGLGIAALTLVSATAELLYFQRTDRQFAEGLVGMRSAAAWVQQHAGRSDAVAVTDWGAMPMLLGRPTVLALNDLDHAYTLRLLMEKQVAYLLIVDEMSVVTAAASRLMVDRYPEIFTLAQSFSTSSGRFNTDVFQVDQEALRALSQSHFPALPLRATNATMPATHIRPATAVLRSQVERKRDHSVSSEIHPAAGPKSRSGDPCTLRRSDMRPATESQLDTSSRGMARRTATSCGLAARLPAAICRFAGAESCCSLRFVHSSNAGYQMDGALSRGVASEYGDLPYRIVFTSKRMFDEIMTSLKKLPWN